jgi:hypothetical protein
MSMSVEKVVVCDGCGKAAEPALDSEDPRATAQADKWVCDEQGDYCPNCHNGEEIDSE